MGNETLGGELAFARLSRAGKIALVFAGVYSFALVTVGAFLIPTYSTSNASSSGSVTHGSATVVAVNGVRVLLVLAVPLLLTLAVATTLSQRPGRWRMPLAWTLTGLFAVFNLLAMLSIGFFLLPVTAALVIACAAGSPVLSAPQA